MSIRILYIGYFRDGTGWGNSAIDYISALDSVGLDVTPRAIKLNSITPEIPDRILELESKKIKNPDVVIQHVLPHHLSYNGNVDKNICLYTTETSNFKNSSWPKHINTMDLAWVYNEQSKMASEESEIDIPIDVIPSPTNIKKFTKSYDNNHFNLSDNFKFYTIGEMNRRKNASAIVRAFHLEFSPEEPVDLIIKTTPVGMFKDKRTIENHFTEIKKGLKLYPRIEDYKKEIIISEYWNEENLMELHSYCDCFVSASHGEAWCIPAFDAMGMGKSVVCSDFSGFKQYLSEDNSWLIPGVIEPVFGENETFHDIFTGRELWFNISISGLMKAMREVYEDKKLRRKKSINAIKRAYDFSYEKIGSLMKESIVKER